MTMTNIKNIPHLSVVALSLFTSSYVCYTYLSAIALLIVAVPLGILLAVFAHYYLLYSINETHKNKRLHQSLIIGFTLTAIVLYMEYNGVKEIAHKATVNTSKLDNLNNTLAGYNSELLKIATSKSWKDIESKRSIQQNIKTLINQIEKEEKAVKLQKNEADNKAQSFRFFSVIMLVLSCVASSCIDNEIKTINKAIDKGIDKAKNSLNSIMEEKPVTTKTAPIGFNMPIDKGIDKAKNKAYLEKYKHIVQAIKTGQSIAEISVNYNISKTTIQNVKRCLNN